MLSYNCLEIHSGISLFLRNQITANFIESDNYLIFWSKPRLHPSPPGILGCHCWTIRRAWGALNLCRVTNYQISFECYPFLTEEQMHQLNEGTNKKNDFD